MVPKSILKTKLSCQMFLLPHIALPPYLPRRLQVLLTILSLDQKALPKVDPRNVYLPVELA